MLSFKTRDVNKKSTQLRAIIAAKKKSNFQHMCSLYSSIQLCLKTDMTRMKIISCNVSFNSLHWPYSAVIIFIVGHSSKFVVFLAFFEKWNKINKNYTKIFWLTNKILTLIIIMLPKFYSDTENAEKFSQNLFLFALHPILFEPYFIIS